MGISKLIERFKKVVDNITEDREQTAKVLALDTLALIKRRVLNKGEGANGQFKPYSDNPIPYWFINPNNYNAPAKVKAFKDKARKDKARPSYKDFRNSYGLPTDTRRTNFDGNMWADIGVEVTEHSYFKTVVEIKAKSKKEQRKVEWNNKSAGQNILEPNKSELEMLKEANRNRLRRIILETQN